MTCPSQTNKRQTTPSQKTHKMEKSSRPNKSESKLTQDKDKSTETF